MGLTSKLQRIILGPQPQVVHTPPPTKRWHREGGICTCPKCTDPYENEPHEDLKLYDGTLGAKILAMGIICGIKAPRINSHM